MKRRLALAAGIAVFLGLLYSLGPADIWRALKSAGPGWLGLTLVFFMAASYLRMYKWLLMRDRMGARISFAEMNGIYFSSKFWGLVSPARSGEVIPALARGEERGRLLSIILYDRVVETFQTLIVFVALFFLFYGEFFNLGTGYALAGVFVALAVSTFVMLSKRAGERVFGFADGALALFAGRRLARSLRAFLQGVKGEMDSFYEATRSYFTVGFGLYNLFITFACWGFDMLFWVALFKAVGIGTPLLVTLTSVMVYYMTSALAPVPGGLGLAELPLVLILRKHGYAGEVGGLIIFSRVLGLVYTFAGYALFRAAGKAEA